jgi:hypothetical protein
MKTTRTVLGLFVLTLATFSVAAAQTAVSAAGYNFVDIKVSGAIETDTYGINNSGVIVGAYVDSSGVQHGMILNGTSLTTIDVPNGTNTRVNGINSSGAVVGRYQNANGVGTGFMYAGGAFTDLLVPGSTFTGACAISDAGDVVGTYVDLIGQLHGFLWNGETYTTLDVPGAASTAAAGINNKGQIILNTGSIGYTTQSAYVFEAPAYKKIDVPGASATYAHAINNNGDVVFTWLDSSSNSHGALLKGSDYIQLVDPNGRLSTRVDGINDDSTIVGRYTNLSGIQQGYMAAPAASRQSCTGNLLFNGGFETGDFTDWTTSGNFTNTYVVSGPYYRYSGAEDGLYYGVLGPIGSNGTLSQTFATTAGANYTFSFWLNAVGDDPSDFSASWDGNQVFSQNNPNTGNVWTKFTFSVTGTGNDTISFSFRDDPAYMALDNVSVCGALIRLR